MFALDNVESADAGADVSAGRIRDLRRNFEAGHFHSEVRGGEGELNEAPGLLQLFFLEPIEWVEIADFTRDAAIERGGVKVRDRTDTALAGQQITPYFFGADTASANQTNARNDNSAVQREFLLYGMGRGERGLLALGVLFDVVHGIFYRGNFFGILVRDFDAEIFFKSHHQLDGVERVGAQIIHKGGGRSHFAFIHTELLDNDRLYAFFDAGHSDYSSDFSDLEFSGRTAGKYSVPRTTLPFYAGRSAGSTFDRGGCQTNLEMSPSLPRLKCPLF